jgi:dTDP-4-dehydrorhamnose reductase
MILLLGATTYVGQGFARELRSRNKCFMPLSRHAFDYTRFDLLFDYVRRIRPELIVNATGIYGAPGVEACERSRMQTFQINTLLPQTVARVCLMTNTPLGHVSSSAMFSGAKVFENGEMRVERDLTSPEIHGMFAKHPERFFGFTELDEPNFSFRQPPCNFYAGTKALAEDALRGNANTYIWRHPSLFSSQGHECNLLSNREQMLHAPQALFSLVDLEEFVRGCLDLVSSGATFGIYNIANTGAATTSNVLELMGVSSNSARLSQAPRNEPDEVPSSYCILDVTKLLHTGGKMRSVAHALEAAMQNWQPTRLPSVEEPAEHKDPVPLFR